MPQRRRRNGFTLIELMVVIVILGLLAGLVVPNVGRYLAEAKVGIAKSQMAVFEREVENFKRAKNRLPDSLNELIDSDGNGFLPGTEIPKDPWGGEYQYSKTDRRKFEIVCLGADGQEGGEAEEDKDITLADVHKTSSEEKR